jgi:hypothetical protein
LYTALAVVTLGSLPACRPEAGPVIDPASHPSQVEAGVGPGSVGCAAASCHGGRIPTDADKRPNEAWRWAATVWRTQDAHSRAYQTLLGRDSRAILDRLGDPSPAERSPRCLSCHSAPHLSHLVDSAAVVDVRYDGIGCESCHGTADRWLGTHLTWSAGANRKPLYDQDGMTWLNDLNVRAAVCAGCHVGAPAGEGAPTARSVNHDLIAAGHPRLNFQFTVYLQAMPPHWQEKDREHWKPLPPHFATRAWSAGQVATLRASLALLADRLPISDQPAPARPWPEFSEFNCFDCHHDLTAANRLTPAAGGKRGRTGWYRGRELQRLVGLNADVTALLEEMTRPRPSADQLRKSVPALSNALKPPPTSPAELLKWVRPGEEELEQLNWDEASWLYYALVAVSEARCDELARHNRPVQGVEEMRRRFSDVAARLRLWRGGGPAVIRYHSPKGYDPAGLKLPFRRLLDQLGELLL